MALIAELQGLGAMVVLVVEVVSLSAMVGTSTVVVLVAGGTVYKEVVSTGGN